MKKSKVALHTASGMIQYADSKEDLLQTYNHGVRLFEIRTDADGNNILWHKGHGRSAGKILKVTDEIDE
jgi:hypothetical protein